MSSFIRTTKHPDTGKWEEAEWLDDYFGKHQYGVKFPDGRMFKEAQVEFQTDIDWKEQFKDEFGIHFKGCVGELGFAIQFIEDLRLSDKRRLEESIGGQLAIRDSFASEQYRIEGYNHLLRKVKQAINKIYQ